VPHDGHLVPVLDTLTQPKETSVTAKMRLSTGAACLAAGICLLTTVSAIRAELPKETTKKVIAADIADLQKKVEIIAADPAKTRGTVYTVRGLALLLGTHGDEALKAQAARVVEALEKKDYKGAVEAAKGLSAPKAGPAPKFEYDLADIMSPFRLDRSGGLNIEKDIRDIRKAKKIDSKDAELIGARAVSIAGFTTKMPNDKAMTNPAMTKKWERWAKEMETSGTELATEGAKGDKADQAKMLSILSRLDASCSNCHTDFRD
jgi:hypothetical protein